MRLLPVLIFSSLVVYSTCLGTPTDQSQTQSETENDWMNGTAQSFTAGYDGLLTAIRLPISRIDGPASLTLEVRHVNSSGIPAGPILASGTLAGTEIDAGATQWYTVALDTPYQQVKLEKLSFTVQQTADGEPYGWLEYGQSTNNPYPGGLMYYQGYYGPSGWTYDEGHLDFAFETLVTPTNDPSLIFRSYTPSAATVGFSSPNGGEASLVEVTHDVEIHGISVRNRMGADGALRFVILGGSEFDVLLATPAVSFSNETSASWKRSPELSFTLEGGERYLIGCVRNVSVAECWDQVSESQNGITSELSVGCLQGFDTPEYSHQCVLGEDRAFRLYGPPPTTTNGTPLAWMDGFGLSTDETDPDLDGHRSWQEYVSGTDPTNGQSCFTVRVANSTLIWSPVSNRIYAIEQTTNITTGFAQITNGVTASPFAVPLTNNTMFFRMKVQLTE